MLPNPSQVTSYMNSGHDIRARMEEVYTRDAQANQAFWIEADLDQRFQAGDQSIYQDYYGSLPSFQKKKFYFNRIGRLTNLITGFQRKNRKSMRALPVDHNDDKAASQWTKILMGVGDKAGRDEVFSEGFDKGSVNTGMTLAAYRISKNKDPISGDIAIDLLPYNSFLIDPYFTKRDLSDCEYVWERRYLSRNRLKELLPKDANSIDHIPLGSSRDSKFQYMPQAFQTDTNHLYGVDYFWYRDTRQAKFIVDVENQSAAEWKGSAKGLKSYLETFPGQLAVKKRMVPTVKLAISVNGHLLYDGKNPLKIDRYPFAPFLGYYNPEISYFPVRCRGVVRDLRDSQFLYNRRKIIELDIFESQINSGVKYKPGSLVDPESIFAKGQGANVPMKDDADMEDYQRIQVPDIPVTMIQLSEILGKELEVISGVNEELLGSATDDKSGVLSMLRQGAGLTTLQKLFDGADFTQKLMGQIEVELVQANYTYGKIFKILGEEPVQEFYHKNWLEYDVRIEEGINTATQRQMEFAQLMELRNNDVPIPAKSLLRSVTLQNKEELIADIEQAEQAQAQAEQMQMQSKMKLEDAQVENLGSQSIANQGLGVERLSRVEENKKLADERTTQALENISQAKLDQVKILKELESMDIDKIYKLMEVAELISAGSRDDVQEVTGREDKPILTPPS